MAFKTLVLLVSLLFLVDISNAEVDCNKPPSPGKLKLTDCCNHELPINEELKDFCLNKTANEEFENAPKPGPHHPLPHRSRCLYECIINETGIYSYEDQVIVEDKLDEFLDESYTLTPEFIPVAKQAFQQCAEKHKEMMSMENNRPQHEGFPHHPHCRVFLLHCMKFEVFKNCPNEYWTESEECNDMREFMNTCPPPTHPHNHRHHPEHKDMMTTPNTPYMD